MVFVDLHNSKAVREQTMTAIPENVASSFLECSSFKSHLPETLAYFLLAKRAIAILLASRVGFLCSPRLDRRL